MAPDRLVLVRHGDTVADSSIRYYGATDVVLSRTGRHQAEAAARLIGDEAFDCVVASPLARAWQTATVLAPRQLPVGVITAFVGVPLFLYLLQRGSRPQAQ